MSAQEGRQSVSGNFKRALACALSILIATLVSSCGSPGAATGLTLVSTVQPPAPTQLRAIAGNGSAMVSFSAPADATVTNYEYTVDGQTWVALTPSDAQSPVLVPGLTSGTVYRIKLRAVAVDGVGQESASVAVRPAQPNQPPTRRIAGPATGLSGPLTAIEVSSGETAVASHSANRVSFFAPGADGNVAPARVIAGPSTGLNIPSGLAELSDGTLAVTNFAANSLAIFPVGASGNVDPLRVIAGPATGMSGPLGVIELDDGSLAVTSRFAASVTVFASDASGNATPLRTIRGPGTGLLSSDNAVELNGGALVVTSRDNSLRTFAPGANGNVAPTNVLKGPVTGLNLPYGLGLVNGEVLAAANYSSGAVTLFAYDASGNVAPFRLIGGSGTYLTNPVGVSQMANGSLVVADSIANSVSFFVEPVTPDAPLDVVATGGDGVIEVSFAPGFDGNSPITNYEYTLDGGTTWTAAEPASTQSPLTIGGLTSGESYDVALRAVNAFGAGEASAVIADVVPFGLPDAPANVVGNAGPGAKNITVTWDPLAVAPSLVPDDNGREVTAYEARAVAAGQVMKSCVVADPSAETCLIEGVQPGTDYTIVVRAQNEVGWGTDGVAPTVVGLPGAPRLLSATPGRDTITVVFEQSAPNGSAVKNYEFSTDGGVTWRQFAPHITGTSPFTGEIRRVSGLPAKLLTKRTTYVVLVRGVNSYGPGAESEALTVQLP